MDAGKLFYRKTLSFLEKKKCSLWLLFEVYQAGHIQHAHFLYYYSAEILNSKHEFWHDEPLPTPTAGGWTEGATFTEIQTDLNIKKWSLITVPQYLWHLFFPLHKFSYFPLQDTNVACLTTQKSMTLIKTTEKCQCEGRQTWICNATAPKQLYYIVESHCTKCHRKYIYCIIIQLSLQLIVSLKKLTTDMKPWRRGIKYCTDAEYSRRMTSKCLKSSFSKTTVSNFAFMAIFHLSFFLPLLTFFPHELSYGYTVYPSEL